MGGGARDQLPDAAEGEMGGTRSRTDFAGSTVRRLKRRTSKRSNPTRSVPHPPAGDAESRGTVQLAGRQRRRVEGESGTFPVNAAEPKPPPVLVLYEDLIGDDEGALAWLGRRGSTEMPAAVYGQYPRALIAKLLPWLRCGRHEILHVCSGALPPGEGIRVDIRPEAKPDILADGRALPLADGSQAAVLIDPPYTEHYAKHLYGVDYPRPSHLLREAARVVRIGGRIGIVHYITPKPAPGTRFVKAFGLSCGFDMPIRAVTIFERDGNQAELGIAGHAIAEPGWERS